MTLSMEVKGTMAEFASRGLSNEKLEILAMKLGVDPKNIKSPWSKRQKALYIFENMSEDHTELALKSIIDSSKKAT